MELPETDDSRTWMGWAAASLLTLCVLGLVVAPVYASEPWRQVIMSGFSTVCHQIPSRSPHLHGVQLAVCDRCLGIYSALFAASLAYPVLRIAQARWRVPATWMIAVAVGVPGVDWLGGIAGIWTNTPVVRFVTGAVFGAMAGYLFTAAATNLASGAHRKARSDNPNDAADDRRRTTLPGGSHDESKKRHRTSPPNEPEDELTKRQRTTGHV